MPTRIILTHQVPGLGAPGDIVEVKDGYARNFLFPRKLAIRASRGAERDVAALRRAREVREVADLSQAQQIASELAALDVRFSARAGAGGRLFGSVTPADVAEAVRASGGPRLDKRRIELSTPIKTAGAHTVTVHLHAEVSAPLVVQVVAAD